MRSRMLVGTLMLLASLACGWAVASAANPVAKWAIVQLTETTTIAGAFVSGPVMFVHDDAKMARGEPCTGVYRFVPGKGPAEQIVAFHCTPRWGSAPAQFTTATTRVVGNPPILTEYQFAGDAEAHGIPAKAR